MSKKFIISTESTSDLTDVIAEKNGIVRLPLVNYVDEETFGGDTGRRITEQVLYGRMREGAKVGTSAVSPEILREFFEGKVKEGYGILHVSFSSALSCCYSNACLAAEEVREEYQDAAIIVVDSLSASAGQGLLVDYCCRMRANGSSLEETAEWLEKHKLNLNHEFTVDDLKYLRKGGRISATAAMIGAIINVKPVLHMDDKGRLVSVSNVRGRKKALAAMVAAWKEDSWRG